MYNIDERLILNQKISNMVYSYYMYIFYIFSVAMLPGPNLTVPLILVVTTGVHLVMLLWILITTVIPFMTNTFDLDY